MRTKMRAPEVRDDFDNGGFELPETEGKVPPLAATAAFLSDYGWTLTPEVGAATKLSIALSDELAAARQASAAAEARIEYFERDRQGFDAAAVLEAGSFEKATLWDREPPDVDTLAYRVKVLDTAFKVANRDLATSVAADPNFEAKADEVWRTAVVGADEETMTGLQLRAYFSSAANVRQHLLALALLHGAAHSMVPHEQKVLRARFRLEGSECPLVPRIRAEGEAAVLAEKVKDERAEAERRARDQAYAAAAARARNPRAD
jgi:hypothetical protein